ncbi:hypothetical protein GJ496_008803 [Pomphorhynchus laevis]|nr:hypothetical protein GJ496_008803 [Pomphorhynchus laevis]
MALVIQMGKPNRQRRQPVTVHNVPPSLQWQLIKFNNCFLEKQNGIKLSRERGNLTNRHGYKWNGLVHNKSIDIQPNATCKSGVTLKLRKRQRNKTNLKIRSTIN